MRYDCDDQHDKCNSPLTVLQSMSYRLRLWNFTGFDKIESHTSSKVRLLSCFVFTIQLITIFSSKNGHNNLFKYIDEDI